MSKIIRNSDIFQALEAWAPKNLAYDWDPIGLQIGSYQKPTKKVMITLDVLEPVVDEAIQKNINLIIAHHPLLFNPLKEINVDQHKGRIVEKILKNDITVYAAHTNLDIAPGGVNDMLSEQLGLKTTSYVVPFQTEKLYKLAVFVPESHAEEIRNAFTRAGAGFIGNYSHCTFQTEGQGTFKPQEGTNPYSGKVGKISFVDEVKIETVVEEDILQQTVNEMIQSHPYEEVAYDIYPLYNQGVSYGLGRIGTIKGKMNLKQFAQKVKDDFQLDHLRIIGDHEKAIQNVAIIGGSGEKYIKQAKQKGADVLITGDMTFHVAQEAEAIGLAVLDAGHYIEQIMKECTKKKLKKSFSDANIEWLISKTNTNPFQWF